MRKSTIRVIALALTLGGSAAGAQPGPGMRGHRPDGRPGGRSGAEVFLAHTGDLKLTDVQVTRLAAVARRTEDRRRALRASMDSAGPMRMHARPDSATRMRMMERMRTTMDREREQSRADLRDALTILTPDQLATAWEMRSPDRGGRGMGHMPEGRRERARGADARRRAPGPRPNE